MFFTGVAALAVLDCAPLIPTMDASASGTIKSLFNMVASLVLGRGVGRDQSINREASDPNGTKGAIPTRHRIDDQVAPGTR
jgi:hypothetical protein